MSGFVVEQRGRRRAKRCASGLAKWYASGLAKWCASGLAMWCASGLVVEQRGAAAASATMLARVRRSLAIVKLTCWSVAGIRC